mgnify:CR=1 FL=1
MNYQELGFLVLRCRRNLRLTQQAFADRLGISRNYISIIERGEAQNPSMEAMRVLAGVMGLKVSELVARIEENGIR